MFESGYWQLGRLAGVPLRLHWSLLLGLLLFGGARFAPAAWLSFVVIVLLHELGHAAFVRVLRHRVLSIDVTGFGGLCRWSGAASQLERSLIAWGGVLAQAVLLVVAVGLGLLGLWAAVPYGAQLGHAFIWTNLWILLLNLLPFPPLDGADAWRLLPELWRRRRSSLGAREGRELLEQILARPPAPRRRPAGPKGTTPIASPPRDRVSDPAASEGAVGGPTSAHGEAQRELAELLRKLGDEAGRARRGGSN